VNLPNLKNCLCTYCGEPLSPWEFKWCDRCEKQKDEPEIEFDCDSEGDDE
jgi:hypothetical protein